MSLSYNITLCDLTIYEIVQIMINEHLVNFDDFAKDRELYIKRYFPEKIDKDFKPY